MKSILLLIAVVSILCCGCGNAVAEKTDVEQNEKVVAELLNVVDELKSDNEELNNKNEELKEELKQREKELNQRDLEIENLEKKLSKSIPNNLYVPIVSSGLKVRSGPGKDYPYIGELEKNRIVRVISIVDSEWAEFEYGNGLGYSCIWYMTPLAEEIAKENEMS